MAEFYLVRHGQASFGAEDYDCLSEIGHQQSRYLGEYFAQREIAFDSLLSGDLKRHQQTASSICTGMGVALENQLMPGLNEFDFDRLIRLYLSFHPHLRPGPQAHRSEYYRLLKLAMTAWSQDELPQSELSESWHGFHQRIREVLSCLKTEYAGKKCLVVSSGGAMAVLLSQVLGFGTDSLINLNLQIRNTSFSHFYFNAKSVRLSSFNNIPHLDLPQRAGIITYS